MCGVAWLPWQPLPTFLTCGGGGLLLWTLQPAFLEQRQLTVPDAARATFTAACSAASSGCLPHSSLAGEALQPLQREARRLQESVTAFAADEDGTIWHLAVGVLGASSDRTVHTKPGTCLLQPVAFLRLHYTT